MRGPAHDSLLLELGRMARIKLQRTPRPRFQRLCSTGPGLAKMGRVSTTLTWVTMYQCNTEENICVLSMVCFFFRSFFLSVIDSGEENFGFLPGYIVVRIVDGMYR